MKMEITTCGDTGQKGLIIWLKTKDKKKAKKKIKLLREKLENSK